MRYQMSLWNCMRGNLGTASWVYNQVVESCRTPSLPASLHLLVWNNSWSHTVGRRTGSSRVQLKLFALPRTADSVVTAVCVCFPVSVQLDPGSPSFLSLYLLSPRQPTTTSFASVILALIWKRKGKWYQNGICSWQYLLCYIIYSLCNNG